MYIINYHHELYQNCKMPPLLPHLDVSVSERLFKPLMKVYTNTLKALKAPNKIRKQGIANLKTLAKILIIECIIHLQVLCSTLHKDQGII